MFEFEVRNTAPPSDEGANGSADAAAVVVDIHAEIAYWEKAFCSSGFHRQDFRFEDYLPSLKFAYDTYLRCYRQSLEALLPALHQKYVQMVPGNQRLDWPRMMQLLNAVWVRLLSSGVYNALGRQVPCGTGKAPTALRRTSARLRNLATRDIHAPAADAAVVI